MESQICGLITEQENVLRKIEFFFRDNPTGKVEDTDQLYIAEDGDVMRVSWEYDECYWDWEPRISWRVIES